MKQPLISIVVPVYNAERYLQKCIMSIQMQNYKNIQIILVNDGSTDESLEICNSYAKLDERICIVNQANQGVVKARKSGVVAADGEYICWVDADDWIEPDYIDALVKLREDSDADIVAVAHFHDIGEDSVLVKNGIPNGSYEGRQLVQTMLCTGEFFEYGITPQLYTKLFSARILKKTQIAVLDNIIAGDDAAVVYPSILEAKKVCISDYAGYHYIQHLGSITKASFPNEEERVRCLIDFLRDVFQKAEVTKETEKQLYVYSNYLLALRKIDCFDVEESTEILTPFGGFGENDRVVIYGAGVLGQKIYKYLKDKKNIHVVDWLDKNYKSYRQSGFKVNSPDALEKLKGDYDYIIIANITEKTAMSIKQFLLKQGVVESAIRWFTKEFRAI